MDKRALRGRLLGQRKALDAQACMAEDAAILRRVVALPQYQSARSVFLYVSTPGEVDTHELIRGALEEGKQVAVPRCVQGAPGRMELCRIYSMEELERGTMGIPEPLPGCELVPPADIDFALVPCVACDTLCNRLGYGGGYYDRVLANRGFFAAAVCRAALVQQRLPTGELDVPVDMVITGQAIYKKDV